MSFELFRRLAKDAMTIVDLPEPPKRIEVLVAHAPRVQRDPCEVGGEGACAQCGTAQVAEHLVGLLQQKLA